MPGLTSGKRSRKNLLLLMEAGLKRRQTRVWYSGICPALPSQSWGSSGRRGTSYCSDKIVIHDHRILEGEPIQSSRKHTENSRSNVPSSEAGGPIRGQVLKAKTADCTTELYNLHKPTQGVKPMGSAGSRTKRYDGDVQGGGRHIPTRR